MNLAFLSPLAFQLLYALPLLIVPYLLRKQETEVVVPALFLYQGLPSDSRRRLWGRPRFSPLFLLQLLLLLLLIAAAARPFLHRQGGKVALVLDTSASMQARAPESTGSLFDLAKRQTLHALDTIPNADSVSLFANTPLPAPVAAPPSDRAQLRTLLPDLAVTDAPDPSDEVLSAFFSQLLGEQGFQQVFFFTDRPLAAPPSTNALTVVTLGGAQPNLAISSFRLYRSPFVPKEIDATVTVTGADTSGPWTLNIEDAETGKRLASRSFTKAEAAGLSLARLPVATTYRARLEIADGLALDNEAYAVLPALTEVPVLLVSPSSEVARSLNSIPNLRLERISPQEYTAARAARFAFVLFHLTAPDAFPPTNAAFFLPPEGNRLFPLGKTASHARVTEWMAAHPLTSYISFPLFAPTYAQGLRPTGWGQAVIKSTVGPLVLAGETEGKRYVATGFDVLPYLGKRNLPVSIFTLNLLGWLADRAGQPPSFLTGASLTLAGDAASIRFADESALPSTGGRVTLLRQGLYNVTEYGVERRLATNLTNEKESRLASPLQLTPLADPTPIAPETTGQPVWPWLLAGALVLLTLDRWLAVRSPAVSQGN